MREKRTIVITFNSDLTDTMFDEFVRDIEDNLLQLACDYAALCRDDKYEVSIKSGKLTVNCLGKVVLK